MVGHYLEFLLCFLNSNLSEFLFTKIGTTTGVGTIRWKKYKIETLFVPQISNDKQIIFTNFVNKILCSDMRHNSTSFVENKINSEIYNICNLSNNEIKFIENSL
jgi:hypothetical protein